MRILLVRHGQTEWNRLGRAQGHTDTPLDDVGVHQAHQLAESLIGQSFDVVWSSDLRRARSTAEAIHTVVSGDFRTDCAIRERSFGTLEGQPFNALRDLDDESRAMAGAETSAQVWSRVAPWADALLSAGQSAVVVSHGGTCGLLLARWLNAGPETARSFRFGNTGVTELYVREFGAPPTLMRFNDTSHLESPSAPMIDLNHARPNL